MSIATLILGESGGGKSASLREVDPDTSLLIQTIKKPLPFRSTGWKPVVTDNWEKIIHCMKLAHSKGRDKIFIDDFQYMLANEFMRRSTETGFTKFTDIGNHAWLVMKAAAELEDNMRVYLLSHTTSDDHGNVRAKTIGKMLDEKITVEGMFTIVLRSMVTDSGYKFATQNNGQDTTKSPMGMFDDRFIDNDIAAVDVLICDYYGITPLKGEQKQ